MSARRTTARYQDPNVCFTHEGAFYFLSNASVYMAKSRLYSLKKRIVAGKVALPVNEGAITLEEDGTVRAGYPKI